MLQSLHVVETLTQRLKHPIQVSVTSPDRQLLLLSRPQRFF